LSIYRRSSSSWEEEAAAAPPSPSWRKSFRRVVVANVPEVLSHGNDEQTHDKDANERDVLALALLRGRLGLEFGARVVVFLLGDFNLVVLVNATADNIFTQHHTGRERRNVRELCLARSVDFPIRFHIECFVHDPPKHLHESKKMLIAEKPPFSGHK